MTTLEIIFTIIDVTVSALALVLVIVGWIIPYRQSKQFEKIKWEKEFIDKQISQLYGPLNASLENAELIRSKVFEQLGRNYVFESGQTFCELPLREQTLWKHYAENYKIPYLNEEIALIKNNYHLLYSNASKTNYKEFIDYALGWQFYCNQHLSGVKNGFNYYYDRNYPYSFREEIEETLSILETRRQNLVNHLEKRK